MDYISFYIYIIIIRFLNIFQYPYDLTSLIHEIRSKNPKSFFININTHTTTVPPPSSLSINQSLLSSPKQTQIHPILSSSSPTSSQSTSFLSINLSESQKRFIIYKLFLGLQQLHANEFIHGDIKRI